MSSLALFHLSYAFMNTNEFEKSVLRKCYDTNMQDSRRTSLRNINGQVLPLPNSIETFISLVERYELLNPNVPVRDVAGKFLKSFRIDDLDTDVEEEVKLRDTSASIQNKVKRAAFSIPEQIAYDFNDEDFTDDEKCALHFMLSHTVNDSRVDDRDELLENSK